ncbi:hypothetical protein D7030_02635 [Flavobacteriaceae bacterium AU392]|nr:hypothetical protein D1817_09110 [Flavobacteriaceae bacterium]RKM85587.1 hypothetical protein D7030_02635 [Flavobacteriaceae bacterium AU392]
MKNKIGLLLLILIVLAHNSFAQQDNNKNPKTITINQTNKTVLLDGHCGNDEWDTATKIDLPGEASIYFMHDKEYFYFGAKGKSEDYTILDLYIENVETGRLHKFHLSAQMGESMLTEDGWKPVSGKWELKDYAGFWVPYNGLEDVEKRIGPKFAQGTHRQMQISRKKFPGNTWKMMIGLGGISHDSDGRIFYPKNGVGDDKSTWGEFSFSK